MGVPGRLATCKSVVSSGGAVRSAGGQHITVTCKSVVGGCGEAVSGAGGRYITSEVERYITVKSWELVHHSGRLVHCSRN